MGYDCISTNSADTDEKGLDARTQSCLRGFANKKDADQPAHQGSLISAFVIPLMESVIS